MFQLNFEDFLQTIGKQQKTKQSAEIRLDLNRLATQKDTKKQNINERNHNNTNNNRKRKRKRRGKVWETQELKEELERKESNIINNNKNNNNIQLQDINTIRAKTRVHLHKILLNKFNEIHNINSNYKHRNTKKRKLNNNNNINLDANANNNELKELCNEIENEIYLKCNKKINKNYMEHSRNLLFNLKRNNLLQWKLIRKDINGNEFVRMNYTQLASEQLVKEREINQQNRLDKMKARFDDGNDNWIECNTVQCSNCGGLKCKYKPKKALITDLETAKAVVFGSVSSKQQNVDMICMKCSYSFKYEISFN